MGKIRIKLLGDESLEQEQKEKAKKRRAAKQAKKGKIRAPGLGGGERVTAVGPTSEELAEEIEKQPKKQPAGKKKEERVKKLPVGGRKPAPAKAKPKHSQRYTQALAKVDRAKLYSPAEAFKLLKETANVRFVSTIDAHFNLNNKVKGRKKENLSFEKKFPLAHGKLGKIDQNATDLEKALAEMIKVVGSANIQKLTLTTSMGPGVKVRV